MRKLYSARQSIHDKKWENLWEITKRKRVVSAKIKKNAHKK